MIDGDNFKQINDTYGHAAGDLVLHTIWAIGAQHLRGHDQLTRYGGDEFVALLPNTALDAATRIALRLAEAVAAETFRLADTHVTLTLSIGAVHADGCDNIAELLARADNAVYRAKRAGRACVQT